MEKIVLEGNLGLYYPDYDDSWDVTVGDDSLIDIVRYFDTKYSVGRWSYCGRFRVTIEKLDEQQDTTSNGEVT